MKIGLSGSSMNNKEYLSGSATPMVGFMNELIQQGHNVMWLEKNPDQTAIDFSPVPVVEFSISNLPTLPNKLDLDLLIIQNWCFNPSLLAKTFKKHGTNIFFWDDNTPFAIERLLKAVPFVDKILTHGDGAAEILMEYIPVKKLEVFYFATDPNRFKYEPSSEFETDIVFVGANIKERVSNLKQVFFNPSLKLREYMFGLYGSGWQNWEHLKDFPIDYRGWINNEDLNKAFSNATISINATRKTFQRINCVPSNRIFDTMASGTVLLSDPIPGIEKLFKIGEELLIAQSMEDATDQIKYILEHPKMAKAIRTHAREKILLEHTWRHRIQQLGLIK
ncbi:MAG: glycosyltransferase [Candidatus Levybacteria bacterium]|nr:glycosyltransferase [Candidatus Levybacteria bacterium]